MNHWNLTLNELFPEIKHAFIPRSFDWFWAVFILELSQQYSCWRLEKKKIILFETVLRLFNVMTW